jgi:hypothetical protein
VRLCGHLRSIFQGFWVAAENARNTISGKPYNEDDTLIVPAELTTKAFPEESLVAYNGCYVLVRTRKYLGQFIHTPAD